jgi:hypothetical protein
MATQALEKVTEATAASLGFLLDEGLFHKVLRHLVNIVKVLDDVS